MISRHVQGGRTHSVGETRWIRPICQQALDKLFVTITYSSVQLRLFLGPFLEVFKFHSRRLTVIQLQNPRTLLFVSLFASANCPVQDWATMEVVDPHPGSKSQPFIMFIRGS